MADHPRRPQNTVFALPVRESFLIYSPLQQLSALVNARAVSVLKKGADRRGGGQAHQLARLLRDVPVFRFPPLSASPHPQFLGLIPTRACNMNCVYCNFKAGSQFREKMTCELASAAIDYAADLACAYGRDTLDVHFFGGEPFVAGDIVDLAVHRARVVSSDRSLYPKFEVSTNGVFDEARALSIGQHFDAVVMSIDGPPDIHDRHRPLAGGKKSSSIVLRSAEIISKSAAKLCVRVCITAESVSRMPEISSWICKNLNPCSICFEGLKPTPESREFGLAPPPPLEMAARFLQAQEVCDEHGIELIYGAALHDQPRRSFCPVGNDTLIVSPDGRINACYLLPEEWAVKGMDLNLGCFDANLRPCIEMKSVERVRHIAGAKPRCRDCFCRFSCCGGCHVSVTPPGCDKEYDDFCIQTRLITACQLIREMGCPEIAVELMGDEAAMRSLAYKKSDRLHDYLQA